MTQAKPIEKEVVIPTPVADSVARLEKEIAKLKVQISTERINGKNDALIFMSYKSKGIIDGAAKLMQDEGIDGALSYAIADRIVDLVKELVKR